MRITRTPQTPSVGPAPRSFTLSLVDQPARPQVGTAVELVRKLAAGFKCIFVTGPIKPDRADDLAADAFGRPDLTDYQSILKIPDGVMLMGGRSPTRFGGLLELTRRPDRPVRPDDRYRFKVFMLSLGSNTRITGLRLGGYNQIYTRDQGDKTRAIAINGSTGVMVDNNEIFGWPHSGVYVTGMPDRRTAPRITGNFIHNKVQCNEGQAVG